MQHLRKFDDMRGCPSSCAFCAQERGFHESARRACAQRLLTLRALRASSRCSRSPPPAASTCTCSRARIRSPAAISTPTSAPRVLRSKAQWPAASCTKTLISTPARSATIPATYMPFPVTKEVLERGRERFNIYLRSLPLAPRRRQRLRSVARIRPQAAVVSTSSACGRRRWDISST